MTISQPRTSREKPDDELFICYHCKADEHSECVGIPCACECPDPAEAGFQRCTFVGCENRGRPQTGFNFYVCDSCFKELDRLLHVHAAEKQKSEEPR